MEKIEGINEWFYEKSAAKRIIDAILPADAPSPLSKVQCATCGEWTMLKDYDPQAGMCGACITIAMNEADAYFNRTKHYGLDV